MPISGAAKLAAGALFGVLLGLSPMKPAAAHPHVWIEVAVQVLFDPAGRTVGLRQTWWFDESYTAFAVEGLGSGKPVSDAVDALARENLKNLAAHAYFTRVTREGEDVPLAPLSEMSSALRGDRLEMTFVLPFAAPLDLKVAPLEYAIFDPTYYIEMLHARGPDAIRLDGAPRGCAHRLIEPSPDVDAASFAAALDRTQTGSWGLGALFAEKVAIRCP